MYTMTFFVLLSVYCTSNAEKPGLKKLQNDLKKDPGIFMGKDFDLEKFLSQTRRDDESHDTDGSEPGIPSYMPTKMDAAEIKLSVQTNLQNDLKKDPGIFMGKDFDIKKYLSQTRRDDKSHDTDGSEPGIPSYMPTKMDAAECHVEFQVTERLPGRCTRLGGRIPACESNSYIGINYKECS